MRFKASVFAAVICISFQGNASQCCEGLEEMESLTPSTQPFEGAELKLNLYSVLEKYEYYFPEKPVRKQKPTNELREKLSGQLGVEFPDDLWTYYERCWNRPPKHFMLFNISDKATNHIVDWNEGFHFSTGLPTDHITFSTDGSGGYYVRKPDGSVGFIYVGAKEYSDQKEDKWLSFADWLDDRINFSTQ